MCYSVGVLGVACNNYLKSGVETNNTNEVHSFCLTALRELSEIISQKVGNVIEIIVRPFINLVVSLGSQSHISKQISIQSPQLSYKYYNHQI